MILNIVLSMEYPKNLGEVIRVHCGNHLFKSQHERHHEAFPRVALVVHNFAPSKSAFELDDHMLMHIVLVVQRPLILS